MTLSFDPSEIALAAHGWDDQERDLRGASATLAAAPTDGFTDAVRGPARRFAQAWDEYAHRLSIAAGAEAGGIRIAMSSVLKTDEHAREGIVSVTRLTEVALADLLRERR